MIDIKTILKATTDFKFEERKNQAIDTEFKNILSIYNFDIYIRRIKDEDSLKNEFLYSMFVEYKGDIDFCFSTPKYDNIIVPVYEIDRHINVCLSKLKLRGIDILSKIEMELVSMDKNLL